MTREEAIQWLNALCGKCLFDEYDNPVNFEQYEKAIRMAIEALQTDEVLCKDCANCLHYDDETENGSLWCAVNTRPTTQDDFCSFAERRE